jgi:hypothetical protein
MITAMLKRLNTFRNLILLLICLTGTVGSALTSFTMKDGSVLTGTIIDQDETNITAQIDFNKITFKKTDITGIVNLPDLDIIVFLRSGSQISGKFLAQYHDSIRISTPDLGEMTILRTNIGKIQWGPSEEKKETVSALTQTSKTQIIPSVSAQTSQTPGTPRRSTFLVQNPRFETEYDVPSALRSMLLPSWGQFSKKETGKGIIIASVETALLGFSIYSMVQENAALNSDSPEYPVWNHVNKLSWLLTGSFYIFNVLDALTKKVPEQVTVSFSIPADGFRLNGTFRF